MRNTSCSQNGHIDKHRTHGAMTTTTSLILNHLHDPEELESLYRQDPEAFREAVEEAIHASPDSIVLHVWRARLGYNQTVLDPKHGTKLWYALGICLAVGALVRLPAIAFEEWWYYPRFGPLWIILGLAGYFLVRRPDRALLMTGVILAATATGYVSLLPATRLGEDWYYTDSVVMALIHLPIALWSYLGLVFLGNSWRDARARVQFLRYNGELVILTSVVGLGGMVLSGLTAALFLLIDLEIAEWYFPNVGVFCAVAVPVGATYLFDAVFDRRTAIAPVLAHVFAPLFLLMVTTYLIVTLVQGANPFIDRSSLITFNGLLLLVLGISMFSLVERKTGADLGLIDYINLALISLTLVINVVALSAILFRITSFGFTPNRVAVLGVNVIALVHLAWILATYIGLVRRKVGIEAMDRVVGNYLPIYSAWAAIVAFFLPVVFGFG